MPWSYLGQAVLGAHCIACGSTIPFTYIRSEGRARRMGYALMAMAAEGRVGRVYLPGVPNDERVALGAVPPWLPETELPEQALGFRIQAYGLSRHADLYMPRQCLALATLSGLLEEVHNELLDASMRCPEQSGGRFVPDRDRPSYADAVLTYLAMAVDKLADLSNTGCPWEPVAECPRNLLARQVIHMHWNFAEGNPLGESSGSFDTILRNMQS